MIAPDLMMSVLPNVPVSGGDEWWYFIDSMIRSIFPPIPPARRRCMAAVGNAMRRDE